MPLSKSRVREIFANLSSPSTSSQYWDHVAPDVHWTILGHSPMSGVYTSRQAFLDATIATLGRGVLTAPLCIEPVNVITSAADSAGETVAVVEMKAIDAMCRNGLPYDMRYCWICTFRDADETIREVRAYIDTDLLSRAMAQNKADA